jgi:response regulator RpfG family c-di-GMP phosphodiesterase
MKTDAFRILALDDEPSMLDLYRRILRTAPTGVHFDLTCCARAKASVQTIRTAMAEGRPFTVAFLDIRMGDGPDGVWAAEGIRKLDPEIGIVIVTGDGGANVHEIERRVPPTDKLFYLAKPFNSKEIRQFSLALSARWAAERELMRIHGHLEAMVAERTAALTTANRNLRSEVKNRREMEKNLRISQRNFHSMILENPDGIIIFDPEQNVRFFNPAAEAIFQRKAEDVIGTSLGYPLVEGGRTELDIVRPDGDLMVVEMRVTRTRWEGEKAHLASLRDISEHNRTKEELRESLEVLENTMTRTVEAMARTLEIRDPYTAGHQYRVALISRAIGEEMGLPSDQILGLYMAALVHDIGKISVPSEFLTKPGRLSKPEMDMIRCHPEDGYDILKDIPFPWPVARFVMQHQERMDGSGYPLGLSGEEITIEARILAVADVVEAMASNRPYRAALGLPVALAEIAKNSGKFYDPEVASACLKLFAEGRFTLPSG